MKEVDRKLIDYLVAGSPDLKTTDWIKDQVANYENAIACHNCDNTDVEIIVDTSAVVRCRGCGQFSSENVTLDKIPSINYNAVSFLQEKKIIEILEVQGKI